MNLLRQPYLPSRKNKTVLILSLLAVSLLMGPDLALMAGNNGNKGTYGRQDTTMTVVDTSVNSNGGPGGTTGSSGDTEAGHGDTATTDTTKTPEAVVMRTLSDTLSRRFNSDKEFAYANDPAYWVKHKKPEQKPSAFWDGLYKFLSSKGFKYFIYLLLAVILLFAFYKIMADNSWKIFEKRAARSKDSADELAEVPQEDLEAMLAIAIAGKDYRTAIRCLFLRSLYLMRDRGLIHFQAESTNQQYIDQVKGYSLAADFRFLVNAYEYTWYGGFVLNDQQFGRLHERFEDLYRSVNAPKLSKIDS